MRRGAPHGARQRCRAGCRRSARAPRHGTALGRGLHQQLEGCPSGLPAGGAQHSTQLLNLSVFASFSLKNRGTYCLKVPGPAVPRQSGAAVSDAGQWAVGVWSCHLWVALGAERGLLRAGGGRDARGARAAAVPSSPCCSSRGSEIRCCLYRKSQRSDFPNNVLLNDPAFGPEERDISSWPGKKKRDIFNLLFFLPPEGRARASGGAAW